MTLMKATPVPAPAMVQAIVQSVWNITKEEATYTIKFGGKSRREVTAPSAIGARELYTQAASRGFAFPFELVRADDKVVGNTWITDATWKAHDLNTGHEWTFMTRGAEPYEPASDTLAVANRKALGKAERNACLRCVPRPIVKSFLALLTQKTGMQAVEDTDASPAGPQETPGGDILPPDEAPDHQLPESVSNQQELIAAFAAVGKDTNWLNEQLGVEGPLFNYIKSKGLNPTYDFLKRRLE